MRLVGLLLFIILIITGAAEAEILPGQFVSWSDFTHITGIAISHDYAYFGTTEGIIRYHRFENKWYPPITISDGLPQSYIERIAISSDGAYLYVDSNGDIISYDVDLDHWTYETDFPLEFYHDTRPQIPIQRYYMSFGYTMYPNGFISDNSLRDYRISALYDDGFNTIYVGTWGMGPVFVDNRDYEGTLNAFGLIQKRTDAIYIDGDSVWLAGNEGQWGSADYQTRFGITLFEQSKPKFSWYEPRYMSGFDSEVIYDITGDDKHIFFAGLHGVSVFSRKKETYFTLTHGSGLPNMESTALAVRNDSLWIGTAEGLALYSPSANILVSVGKKILGDLFITDLQMTRDKLLIGTTKGAYYIDFKTKLIGSLKDPHGDLTGLIRHISHYENEVLFSTDYGVTTINLLTERSSTLPYVNGPPGAFAAAANDKIYAVAVSDGLMLINKENGKRNLLTEDDGLLSLKISTLVSDGKYLWIGSDEGLTRFDWSHPDRID
ncbi:MAG: hypothetical protein KAR42_00585 [candidate division Zixibacteria bacterium]|nr:hypothetical protein [candidate division Zixibacteria bacterium]